MRTRALLAASTLLSVAACTDSNVLTPAADPVVSGPSYVISDAGNGGPVDGFWFLPPLAKQVTTSGVLDESLDPSMEVCELAGNPSAEAPGGDPTVGCVTDPSGDPVIVTRFAAGSAAISPGEHYQFSWDTSPTATENVAPMDPLKYYRIRILSDGVLLGFLDVNPQNPAPETPGEDFDDLYAFRLGETLPVKFFANLQVRCDEQFRDGYVVQCIAEGVIDADGLVLSLQPITGYPATLSTVVPPNALPPGYPEVVLTMERIDPQQFLMDEQEECIPGLAGLPGVPTSSFDAPQFGDCLRLSTDPVLPVELELAALIEICTPFNPTDFPALKFLEEQDGRLQIIRYGDDGETQGLPNVDATTCGAPQPSPAQMGFFPIPREDGFLRTAAVAANTVARWLGPEPLMAHGDIRLGGATTEFSRFRWGLPGHMNKLAGDGVVIQQLEDGSESYDVTATVEVVDAGSPDLSLPPSTVEGATVHFSGATSVSPADVTTLADGIAATTWSVPQTLGVHTMDARALGLLASAVPVHNSLVSFTEETVTFSATVVGPPSSSSQSPPSTPPFEALPGETIQTPLTITVLDANGEPVSDWSVTWTTSCSSSDPLLCDGFVSNDADGDPTNDDGSHLITDENGQATGYWTLATVPSQNTLTTTVGGQTFNFVAGSWTAIGGCQVTVDGNQSTVPGEWDCAVSAGNTASFLANISGGDTPAEVRWQVDSDNLYFLVLVQQASLDKANSLRIDFDNTLDGATADDDAIGFIADGDGVGQAAGTPIDEFLTDKCVNRSQSGCGSADTDAGGQMNVTGALDNDGTYTVYELSHPLNSMDGRDIELAVGDPFGFYLSLSIGNGAQGNTQFPGFRDFLSTTAN